MPSTISEIILVYNAGWSIAGAIQYLVEALRDTDSCGLCAITHHAVGEKRAWKDCKEGLGVGVRALYRNQLTPELSAIVTSYPCVLVGVGGRNEMLLGRSEIESCMGDPKALVKLIRAEAGRRKLELPSEPPPVSSEQH